MSRIKTAVTSSDVARAAGVSQSAVSRAFTPGASIGDGTRRKVIDAANKLGYRRNAIARTLITRQSQIIAVVVSYLENQFYPRVLELLSQQLQRDGYHLLLFISDSEHADELLIEMMQYQVDGIVLASVMLSSELAFDCYQAGVPVVLFNRIAATSSVNSVSSDNLNGGRLAAKALINSGHRRVGFIAGLEDTSTSRDRERGFVQVLQEHGMALYRREAGHYNFESAQKATLAMFGGSTLEARPDAVFVANDHMAIAVMDTLRYAIGLSVPDDVSVIGFDNVPQAGWDSYQLTTVEQPAEEMTQAAVSILLAQMRDKASPVQHVSVPVKLIVRGSVGPITSSRQGC